MLELLLCRSGEAKEFKIEGDVGVGPIWCNQCGCNLDIEDIPISEELAEELSLWAAKYGEWIDWKIDKLLPNGIELEDKFNQIGVALTEKLKRELGGKYKMTFMPSSSARFYAQSERSFR